MRGIVRVRNALSAALLTGAAAVGLHDAWSAPEPAHRAEWIRAGDVNVRAVRMGTGDTTIVLMHGYGESLLAWRGIADRLARRYRVLAFDLPGFGAGDKPDAGYDLATTTARVADLVRRSARRPTILVGHSVGGEIAASVALAYPDLVQGLVLIAPAGFGVSQAAGRLPDAAKALAGATTPLLLPVHDPRWLAEPPAMARYEPLADPEYRRATALMIRDFDFSGIGARFRAVRQPTLLIWGRLDPTIPLSTGRAIAGMIHDSCLRVLDHGLHRPHEAQPDTVFALISSFLEAQGSKQCHSEA